MTLEQTQEKIGHLRTSSKNSKSDATGRDDGTGLPASENFHQFGRSSNPREGAGGSEPVGTPTDLGYVERRKQVPSPSRVKDGVK